MANHKSSLKRMRQNERIRINNKFIRTTVRSAIKYTRNAIDAKDKDKAAELLKQATVAIDKATGSGLYHQNNAARKISRLTRQVAAL